MRQILHIFRKDVRQLWLPIVVVLLLTAAFAIFDILHTPISTPETARINQIASLLSLLLTFAWWYLIAVLIYQEVLPGDRQFWLTRPYSWKALLGAKILFILVFLNVPLFISDCFILGTQGFPVLADIPGLIFRQIPLSVLLVLPSFALATVTSGFTQFVLAWFLIFLGTLAESFLIQTGNSVGMVVDGRQDSFREWTDIVLMLAIAGFIILWQYSKRRTPQSRAVLVAFVFVIMPGVSAIPVSRRAMLAIHARIAKQQIDFSKIHLAYDLARRPPPDPTRFQTSPGFVRVELSLGLSGLPPDTAVTGFGEVKLEPDNESSKKDLSTVGSQLVKKDDGYWQIVFFNAKGFERIQSQPVTLRTMLYLTAITDRVTTRAPVWQKKIAVPDVGVCESVVDFQSLELSCIAGLHPPQAASVRLEYPGFRSPPAPMVLAPSSQDVFWTLSPVEKWAPQLTNANTTSVQIREAADHTGAQLAFTPQRPLGSGVLDLQIQNVHLTDYIVP